MSVTQHQFWTDMANACKDQADWYANKSSRTPISGEAIHDLYNTLQMICVALANTYKQVEAPPIEMDE